MSEATTKPTDKQRIEFTKQIEYFYERTFTGWWRMIAFSFVKGVATGLGVFIGGTIIVGLLLLILSGLGHIPLLNDVTDQVKSTLEQRGN